MQHTLSLTRLSDGAEINASSLTVALDADAWAWTWSANLLGEEALARVLPSPQGEPVTLEAVIDGHVWHLLAEDWSESREFARRGLQVTGRGLSAELGEPYALPESGQLANARSVQQALAERLPLGGGWTLAWRAGTPDWLLPSGSWSWTGAPAKAIAEVAAGAGLVVVPAMASKTVTIQPRYPVLPWGFADATPDMTIPDSAILQITRRQAIPAQANAVYVHGYESGGISSRVYRDGTAGDLVAATESSGLITHTDAARLLGSRLLAKQAAQSEVRSITLPLGGDFPLLSIGNLAAVELGVGEHRGIVNAVSVSATGDPLQVRQTITIGEDTPNVWAKWRRILPGSPLLIATVAAVHGDATRTVELIGGGTQRVRGEGDVGAIVWVRGGRIEGDAPALAHHEITV